MSGCHVPMNNEGCKCVYCLSKRIDKLENQVKDLEGKYSLNRAHKCIVCDGKGIVWNKT
jgi:hypothetical protein